MKDKVLRTIKKYSMLSVGDSVAIGVSGGKDSIALLSLLSQFKSELSLTLTAVHINHGIRGKEADADERFVKEFCEKLSVELKCFHFNVPLEAEKAKMSEEECGRELRYKAFNSLSADKIATAHTLSDSVETMLFNLARGSGAKGLCGIPPVRKNIIRPLIECTSDEVLDYLKNQGLEYREDSTNLSADYSRNAIRLKVIPELKRINPSFELSAAKTASILKEENDFLRKKAAEHIQKYSADVKALLSAEPALRYEVIRLLCENEIGVVPEYKHIQAIDELLSTNSSVKINSGAVVRVRKGKLEFPKAIENSEYSFVLEEGEYKLPIGVLKAKILNCEQFENLIIDRFSFCADYDKIKSNLVCRNKHIGDSFYDSKRKLTKTMKKYLNEIAAEPEIRQAFPVFVYGGEVIGTLGSTPSVEYAANKNSKKIMYVVFKGE